MYNALNLNISFLNFNLKYSGEACVQERVVITSLRNKIIGRYCGQRYKWSVFVSAATTTLRFHTFEFSRSYLELHYEITHFNLTTCMLNFKNYKDFRDIEEKSNVFPYSWIHKYVTNINDYYNWNIFVSKISKLSLKLKKVYGLKGNLYVYDGPDYHFNQYFITNMTSFISSSFQVSVLFHGYFSFIEMYFNDYLEKETEPNYRTYLVKDKLKMSSRNLKCATNLIVLCVLNFNVSSNLYVNVTLEYFNYSGPNVGYCKYGGLSVYDYVNNTKKEVLLICNNWASSRRLIISNTESLFLMFYSYYPYSQIEIKIRIESSPCQGVHLQK